MLERNWWSLTKSRFIAIMDILKINNDNNLNIFYLIPFLLSVGEIAE